MRGDLCVARGPLFGSKARPVLIVQDETVDPYESTVTCLLTSFDSEGLPMRVRVEPSSTNGLEKTSFVMCDKIMTFRKCDLTDKIGELESIYLDQVDMMLRSLLRL